MNQDTKRRAVSNVIRDVAEFSSQDDKAALDRSRNLLKAQPGFHGFGLWQGTRRIHRELAALGGTMNPDDAIKTNE